MKGGGDEGLGGGGNSELCLVVLVVLVVRVVLVVLVVLVVFGVLVVLVVRVVHVVLVVRVAQLLMSIWVKPLEIDMGCSVAHVHLDQTIRNRYGLLSCSCPFGPN